MTPDEIDYIRYRLGRAEETLREAKLLVDHHSVYGAVNRLYYACFYAVSGLLLVEGLYSTKHTGVRALFARHWIKPKRVPVEMGRSYYRLFDLRQQGDYERVTFSRDDVEVWLQEAQAFVVAITGKAEQLLREQQDEES